MNNKYKSLFFASERPCYNPTIVNLIIGIQSAHVGLCKFFKYLKENSKDYQRDVEFIKNYPLMNF